MLAAALAAIGRPAPLPLGYTLRSRNAARFADLAGPCGFASATGPFMSGDVAAFNVGPHQLHLAIAVREGRFVHAHAGLRRVVIATVPRAWAVAGHWRLTSAPRPTPDN